MSSLKSEVNSKPGAVASRIPAMTPGSLPLAGATRGVGNIRRMLSARIPSPWIGIGGLKTRLLWETPEWALYLQ